MEQKCCCRSDKDRAPGAGAPWVTSTLFRDEGAVNIVATRWTRADYTGAVRCRINDGFRMNYTVQPGLYGTGSPTENAPVCLTANYKLSFDHLRRALDGHDAWILVLDTKGINVWCAAGSGCGGNAAGGSSGDCC